MECEESRKVNQAGGKACKTSTSERRHRWTFHAWSMDKTSQPTHIDYPTVGHEQKINDGKKGLL